MAVPNSAVKVGVYFSFNEQGKKFLLQQLMPFYKPEVPIVSPEARAEVDEAANQALLQAMIETELIPWGDTVYNESNTNPFECESEEVCHANRLLVSYILFFWAKNHKINLNVGLCESLSSS